MGIYLKIIFALSLIIGLGLTTFRLHGEVDSLGLMPVAFVYYFLRYTVISIIILWPLSLIAWCLTPSPKQPQRGERFVYITFAVILLLLIFSVSEMTIKQVIFRHKAYAGHLLEKDLTWFYSEGSRDGGWEGRTMEIILSQPKTQDWVFRSILEHLLADTNESFSTHLIYGMIGNPSCPSDVLERLTRHKDSTVSERARQRLLKK